MEKCLIIPIGKFGEHWKGYSGCLWCPMDKECMEKSPWKGKSLIFKEEPERAKIIRTIKVKPVITRSKLKGFFSIDK